MAYNGNTYSIHDFILHFEKRLSGTLIGGSKQEGTVKKFYDTLDGGERAIYDRMEQELERVQELRTDWRNPDAYFEWDTTLNDLYGTFDTEEITNAYLMSEAFSEQKRQDSLFQSDGPSDLAAEGIVDLTALPVFDIGSNFPNNEWSTVTAKRMLADVYLMDKAVQALNLPEAPYYTRFATDIYAINTANFNNIIRKAANTIVRHEKYSDYSAPAGLLTPTRPEIQRVYRAADVDPRLADDKLTDYFNEYTNYIYERGNDPHGYMDLDKDGVQNSEDDFYTDANETKDSDGDSVGDNSDHFPNNHFEWYDSDSDGFGDNSDQFPNNPNEWADANNDGVGDNEAAGIQSEADRLQAQQDKAESDYEAELGEYYEAKRLYDQQNKGSVQALADDEGRKALLDFDGSGGDLDALTDGLLLMRYAFGLRGEMLTKDAISPNSTRTTEEINAYMRTILDEESEFRKYVDLDSDGTVDALTDGLLLLRYSFGLTGSMLSEDATAPNSSLATEFGANTRDLGVELAEKIGMLGQLAFEITPTGEGPPNGYDIDLDTAYNIKTGLKTEYNVDDHNSFAKGDDLDEGVQYDGDLLEPPTPPEKPAELEFYDSDDDGVSDVDELTLGGDPYDNTIKKWQDRPNADSTYGSATDWDGDGILNAEDEEPLLILDADNDGVTDIRDEFPTIPNAKDSDKDGFADSQDKFPNDASEWYDYDNDGVGNNADEFDIIHSEVDQNNNNIPDVEEDLDEDGILDLKQDVDPNKVRQLTEHYMSGDWDQDGVPNEDDFDQFDSGLGERADAATSATLGSQADYDNDFAQFIKDVERLSAGEVVKLRSGMHVSTDLTKATRYNYETGQIEGNVAERYQTYHLESLEGFINFHSRLVTLSPQEKEIAAVLFPDADMTYRSELVNATLEKVSPTEYKKTSALEDIQGDEDLQTVFSSSGLEEVFRTKYETLVAEEGLEAALAYAEATPSYNAPEAMLPYELASAIGDLRYEERIALDPNDLSDEHKSKIRDIFRAKGLQDIGEALLSSEDSAVKDYYADAFAVEYEKAMGFGNSLLLAREGADRVSDQIEANIRAYEELAKIHYAIGQQMAEQDKARLEKFYADLEVERETRVDANRAEVIQDILLYNAHEYVLADIYVGNYRDQIKDASGFSVNDTAIKQFEAWRRSRIEASGRLPNKSEVDSWARDKGWITPGGARQPDNRNASLQKVDALMAFESEFLAAHRLTERDLAGSTIVDWIAAGKPDGFVIQEGGISDRYIDKVVEQYEMSIRDTSEDGGPVDMEKRQYGDISYLRHQEALEDIEEYFSQLALPSNQRDQDRFAELEALVKPALDNTRETVKDGYAPYQYRLGLNFGASKRLGDYWRESLAAYEENYDATRQDHIAYYNQRYKNSDYKDEIRGEYQYAKKGYFPDLEAAEDLMNATSAEEYADAMMKIDKSKLDDQFYDVIEDYNVSSYIELSNPITGIEGLNAYDGDRLYMKLPEMQPPEFGTYGDWVSGVPQNDETLMNRFAGAGMPHSGDSGYYVDVSGGEGEVGDYTMMWVELNNSPSFIEKGLIELGDAIAIVQALLVIFGGPEGAKTAMRIGAAKVALKVLDGQTLHGEDWASLALFGMSEFGQLVMPMGEEEALTAAQAEATKLGLKGAEYANKVKDLTAINLAGIGIAGLNAKQTVALIKAAGSGDIEQAIIPILSDYGAAWTKQALGGLGLPDEAINSISDENYAKINELASNVASGMDFDAAALDVGIDWLVDLLPDVSESATLKKIENWVGGIGEDLKNLYRLAEEFIVNEDMKAIGDYITDGIEQLPLKDLLASATEDYEAFAEKIENSIDSLNIPENFDRFVVTPIDELVADISAPIIATGKIMYEELPEGIQDQIEKMGRDIDQLASSTYDHLDDGIIAAAKQGVIQSLLENDGTIAAKASIASQFTRELVVAEELKGLESLVSKTITPGIISVGLRTGINALLMNNPNPTDTALKAMGAAAASAIRKSIDAGTFNQEFATYWDGVSGEFDNAVEKKSNLEDLQDDAKAIADEMRPLVDRKAEIDKQIADAQAIANDPNATATQKREAIALMQDSDLQAEQARITLDLAEYAPQLAELRVREETLLAEYDEAKNTLSLTSKFSPEVAEYNQDILQITAAEINPALANLSPEGEAKYREMNGLAEDEDVYAHYVGAGVFNGAPVTVSEYNSRIDAATSVVYHTVVTAAGLDDTKLTDEERLAIRNRITTQMLQDAEAFDGTPLQFVEGIQPGYYEVVDFDRIVVQGVNDVYVDADGNRADFGSIANINNAIQVREYEKFRDDPNNPFYGKEDLSTAQKNAILTDLVNGNLVRDVDAAGQYIWRLPPSTYQLNPESGTFELTPTGDGITLPELIDSEPSTFMSIVATLPVNEAVEALNIGMSYFTGEPFKLTNILGAEVDTSKPIAGDPPLIVSMLNTYLEWRDSGVDAEREELATLLDIPEAERSLYEKDRINALNIRIETREEAVKSDALFFRDVAELTESINVAVRALSTGGQELNATRQGELAKRRRTAELLGDEYNKFYLPDYSRLNDDQLAEVNLLSNQVTQKYLDRIDYSAAVNNDFNDTMGLITSMSMGHVPAMYKEKTEEMQKGWDAAEGGWEKTKAIFGSIATYPEQVLREVVIPEISEFVVGIGIGRGAGYLTTAASKKIGNDIAKQYGDPSVGVSILTEVGIEVGGSYKEGYEKTYQQLTLDNIERENRGEDPKYTEEEILAYAHDAGYLAGNTAAIMMAFTGGIGFKLNERILGHPAYEGLETFADYAKDSALVIGGDMVANTVQEVAVAGSTENFLWNMGYTDRDWTGELAENGALSIIGGGPTAAVGYGMSLLNSNPNLKFAVEDTSDPMALLFMASNEPMQNAIKIGSISQVKDILDISGIDQAEYKLTYNSIMNAVDDAGYVTVLEAEKSFAYLGVEPSDADIAVAIDMQDGSSGTTLDEQLAAYWKSTFGEETLGSGRTTAQTYDIIKHLEDMKDGIVPVDSTFVDVTTGEPTITQEVVDEFKASLSQREQDLLDEYDTSNHVPTNIVQELGGSLMTQEEINKINEDIAALQALPDAPSASEVLEVLLQDDTNAGIPNQVKNLVDAAFVDANNQAAFATAVVDSLKEDGTLKTLTEEEVAGAVGSNTEGKESGIYLALKNLETDISSGDDDAATNLTTALGNSGTFTDGVYNEDGTGVYGELSALGVSEAAARKAIEDLVGKPAEGNDDATGIFLTLDSLSSGQGTIDSALTTVTETANNAATSTALAELSGVVGLPARPKLNEDGTEVKDASGKVVMLPPTGVYLAVQEAIAADGDARDEILRTYVDSAAFEEALTAATNDKIDAVTTAVGNPEFIRVDGFSKPLTAEAAEKLTANLMEMSVGADSSLYDAVVLSGNDPLEYFDFSGNGLITAEDVRLIMGLPTSEDGASFNDLLADAANGLQLVDRETVPATGIYEDIETAISLEGVARDAALATLSQTITEQINSISGLPASEAAKIKDEIVNTYFPTAPELTAEDLAILPEVNYMLSVSGEEYFNSDDFKALPEEQQTRLKEYNTYLEGGSLGAQLRQVSLDADYNVAGLESKIATLETNLNNTITDDVLAQIGKPAEGNDPATGLYAAIADGDADISAVLGAVGEDGSGILRSLEIAGLDIGEIQTFLTDNIGAPATEDDDATGLFAAVGDNTEGLATLSTAVDAVKADIETLQTDVGDIQTDIGTLQTDVTTINTAIGTASSIDDEDNVVAGTGLIGQLEALGVEDAAILEIIGSPATDEAAATGLYLAMETAVGSSEEDLLALIGSPATDEAAATGLYALIDNTVTTGVDGLATEDSVTNLGTAIGTASSTDDDGNVVAGTGVIGQVEAVEGAVTTIEGDIGDLQTDVEDIQTDVGDIQTDVGDIQTDVGDIQTDVGDIQTDVTDLQTDVATRATQDDLTAAEDRLTAAEENYATLEAGLGTTASQADLDAANETLLTAQSDVAVIQNQLLGIEGIDEDIENIAAVLGKPSNLLTEDDIALATSYLGMAEDELAQADVLRYDVDAVEGFTQADVDLMSNALQTGDYSGLKEGSAFNVATGMFATQEANQAQIQQYQEDIIAREQQYQEDLEAQRQLNEEMQQQQNLQLTQQFQQDLQDAEEREKQEQVARALSAEGKMETRQSPLANIGYFVDMGADNIFANEQQQGFYGSASPFGDNFLPGILNPQQGTNFKAKGGMIKDKTDEILRIIGEK